MTYYMHILLSIRQVNVPVGRSGGSLFFLSFPSLFVVVSSALFYTVLFVPGIYFCCFLFVAGV